MKSIFNKYNKKQSAKFAVRDLRGNYLRIENPALELVSEEGSKAIAVYAWICWHANNKTETCYPSLSTLAKKCKISRRTVIRIIRFLEDIKLIAIDRTQKGEHGAINVYYLLGAKSGDSVKSAGDKRDTSVYSVTSVVTKSRVKVVTPQHLKQELIKQKLMNNKDFYQQKKFNTPVFKTDVYELRRKYKNDETLVKQHLIGQGYAEVEIDKAMGRF